MLKVKAPEQCIQTCHRLINCNVCIGLCLALVLFWWSVHSPVCTWIEVWVTGSEQQVGKYFVCRKIASQCITWVILVYFYFKLKFIWTTLRHFGGVMGHDQWPSCKELWESMWPGKFSDLNFFCMVHWKIFLGTVHLSFLIVNMKLALCNSVGRQPYLVSVSKHFSCFI